MLVSEYKHGELFMGRKKESLKINEVIFTYVGTDNDLTSFFKVITHDHLVKTGIITDRPIKEVNVNNSLLSRPNGL